MNLIFAMVYRTTSPTHLEFTCTMCTTYTQFCSSATTRAECFSPDKSSAVLLPQLQNVSHQRNILLSCYHKDRMFLTRRIFCCPATTKTECFLPEKYFAVLVTQ